MQGDSEVQINAADLTAAQAAVEEVKRGRLIVRKRSKRLALFETVIKTPDGEFPLSPDVSATVEVEGQVQTEQGWVLRSDVDNRDVFLTVRGPGWSSVIRFNVLGGGRSYLGKWSLGATTEVRQLAERINAAASGVDAAMARLAPEVAKAEQRLAQLDQSLGHGADRQTYVRTVLEAQTGRLDRMGAKKPLERLAEALGPDEQIRVIATGVVKKQGNAIVAVTDDRLLLADGTQTQAVTWTEIEAVSAEPTRFKTAMASALDYSDRDPTVPLSVTTTAGDELRVKNITPQGRVYEIVSAIERARGRAIDFGDQTLNGSTYDEIVGAPQPTASPAPPTAEAATDPLEQIKRLGELRDAGLLTVEEFTEKKADLLRRI